MNKVSFYLRFGVHKDRGVIKTLRDNISGIVIPAHILSYSPNPTISAISYIDKPFFIDPMTYIYADNDIKDYVVLDETTKTKNFKPSIEKMTLDYNLTSFFAQRNYTPLKIGDFSTSFIEELCKHNIILQEKKIDKEKSKAYKKYTDLLMELGQGHILKSLQESQSPLFIIPPYFYIPFLSDGWVDINLKMIAETKKQRNKKIVPIILTRAENLTKTLLDKYTGNSRIIIWVDDLDEKRVPNSREGQADQIKKLENYIKFIKIAKSKNIEVINLYGTYFSIILSKIGLNGFCNGIFYGEYKSRKSKVGGGPPARYYIRELHEFFSTVSANLLLKSDKYKTLLDTACTKCMQLIGSNIDNILTFDKNHSLAQRHFIYAREAEIEEVATSEISSLIANLVNTYANFSSLPEVITEKKTDYLNYWVSVLNKETPQSTP